jgi:hypothetical protein
VECKRYHTGHMVGAALVRQLLGVQVREGIRHAQLVTTSGFTKPAHDETAKALEVSRFVLELVDASDLIRALSLYNTALPALDRHPLFREP